MYILLRALHHLLFDCATGDHQFTACIWRILMDNLQRLWKHRRPNLYLQLSMVCLFLPTIELRSQFASFDVDMECYKVWH